MRQIAQKRPVWQDLLQRAVAYGLPEVPILAAALIYTHSRSLQQLIGPVVFFYPYGVFGAGVLLGWRFRRSRLLFALLLLTLVDRTLVELAPLGGDPAAFQAMAFLLPLNLAALALTAERGFLTPPGLARLGIILAQLALVAILAREASGATAALLQAKLLPPRLFGWTPIGHLALLAFFVSMALIVASQLLSPTQTGRSFFWSLIAAFLGLSAVRPTNPGWVASFYFATSALILIVAVVEASYHMAYQDSLTGLPARRALNEALLRLGGQYTVAMVDVDHFKRINDSHGHDVGDQVLRMVATKLAQVGGGGKAYRYGGEEFAVIFPGKSAEACLQDLEALRRTIEDTKFILRSRIRSKRRKEHIVADKGPGKRVPVTVSIGVAEKEQRHTKSDQVVKAADRALYRAKDGGRNQVRT